LGGWIVATYALQFPQNVSKLILNDAAGTVTGSIAIPVDLNVSTRTHMRTVFELMFYDKSMVTDELVDLAYSLHLERGDGYTIKSVLETLADTREKLDAKLAQISAPTLIVWGEDDAITPLSMARAFHGGIAGSLLQTIPRCGHFPPIEKPNEFVAAVTAFLRAG
jgi:pimeloyl-ACP methyl ester carboxylesterase